MFFFHFLFEFGWSTIYLAPSFFAGSPITGRIAGEVYFSTSPSGRQSRRASLPLFVHVSRYYSSCSRCLLIFTLRREKSKAGCRNAARERRTRGGSRATLWLERRKYLNCNGDFDRVEFSGRRCGAGLSFFLFFFAPLVEPPDITHRCHGSPLPFITGCRGSSSRAAPLSVLTRAVATGGDGATLSSSSPTSVRCWTACLLVPPQPLFGSRNENQQSRKTILLPKRQTC